MKHRRQRALLQMMPFMVAGIALPISPASASDGSRLVDEIASFVQERAERGEFSGAVLVAKDGVAILETAHGYASLDYDVPNRVDTKFNLGSMNKMFTAVAIAQLVERGLLSFDDRIVDRLPDYANREVAARVTIHHLLTHTSGLGNYWTEEYQESSKDRFRAVADYLPLFVDQPLRFEPGSQYSYSNSGFMVLGLVLERVTGKSYFDYVRENIYAPAGMSSTDAYELDHVVPNHAVGYTRSAARPGELMNNLFLHVVKGGPAGGGYSTVQDLLSFSNALLGHRLLTEEMTRTVLAGKVETEGPGSAYAYGFRSSLENGHRIVGHAGGFSGISSYLDMYPDLGYVVAVMSNRDLGAVEVREFIQVKLVGKTHAVRSRELTEAILEHLATHGYEAGLALYERRKEEGTVSERRVNEFAYSLLARRETDRAIDVFRFNVHLHPESANAHDSLGEGYMLAGETELAILSYERSVELDAGNVNGMEMLEKLRAAPRR